MDATATPQRHKHSKKSKKKKSKKKHKRKKSKSPGGSSSAESGKDTGDEGDDHQLPAPQEEGQTNQPFMLQDEDSNQCLAPEDKEDALEAKEADSKEATVVLTDPENKVGPLPHILETGETSWGLCSEVSCVLTGYLVKQKPMCELQVRHTAHSIWCCVHMCK